MRSGHCGRRSRRCLEGSLWATWALSRAICAQKRAQVNAPAAWPALAERIQRRAPERAARAGRHLRQQVAQRVEEAGVLLRCAVGDAQGARAAEGAAGADEDTALGEAVDDRGFGVRTVREVEPAEVRLGLGGLDAELVEAVLHLQAGDDRALDAGVDGVGVLERLDRGSLGGGVAEERLAHL